MSDKNEALTLVKQKHHDFLLDKGDKPRYVREHGFTPIKGSICFKPSFAGREIQLGLVNGEPVMSNGVWFEYTGGIYEER